MSHEISLRINMDRSEMDLFLKKLDRINELCEEVSSLLEELTSTDLFIPVTRSSGDSSV